jgi:hypothetical protein
MGSRLFLLGGCSAGRAAADVVEPGRTYPDEIAAAAADWREGRFGTVADYDGEPLAARPLDVARLIPRR